MLFIVCPTHCKSNPDFPIELLSCFYIKTSWIHLPALALANFRPQHHLVSQPDPGPLQTAPFGVPPRPHAQSLSQIGGPLCWTVGMGSRSNKSISHHPHIPFPASCSETIPCWCTWTSGEPYSISVQNERRTFPIGTQDKSLYLS